MSAPFVISRDVAASPERAWKAWTDQAELKQWWGPAGAKVHTCKVDLRPGGMFLYGMTTADGTEIWGRFIYREIVPPRRLVFLVSFSDPKGGVTRNPWNEVWPLHMMSVVTLEAQGAGTRVTVEWTPHEPTDAERKSFDEGRDSMKQGWGGTLDKLVNHVMEGSI